MKEYSVISLVKDAKLWGVVKVNELMLIMGIQSDLQNFIEMTQQQEFADSRTEKKVSGKLPEIIETLETTYLEKPDRLVKDYEKILRELSVRSHAKELEELDTNKTGEIEPERKPDETDIRAKQLEILSKKLSPLEKEAYTFVFTKEDYKGKISELFTNQGIFQLANRASLKLLIYKNRLRR